MIELLKSVSRVPTRIPAKMCAERYTLSVTHLIAWLPNQMIRREAVVACRRCFVTSQTVIKYGGYRQSNLILFGSCSCTSFLRGKKETKKNMASIFRASLLPFFRAVDQTFFPRSCPVRWKSASSQAQVKLLILRKRITNRMCSYIITSYSWLVFRIFCKVKVTVSTPYKNYEVMYFQNTTTPKRID